MGPWVIMESNESNMKLPLIPSLSPGLSEQEKQRNTEVILDNDNFGDEQSIR